MTACHFIHFHMHFSKKIVIQEIQCRQTAQTLGTSSGDTGTTSGSTRVAFWAEILGLLRTSVTLFFSSRDSTVEAKLEGFSFSLARSCADPEAGHINELWIDRVATTWAIAREEKQNEKWIAERECERRWWNGEFWFEDLKWERVCNSFNFDSEFGEIAAKFGGRVEGGTR